MRDVNPIYKARYGHELQSPALGRFYKRNGYKGKIKPQDLCCWLEIDETIMAAARILVSNNGTSNFSLLRGLWVLKEHRRQQFGSQLLNHINSHIADSQNDLYCLALPYLEPFYKINNYQKIKDDQIPNQLREMQQRYNRRGQETTAMILIDFN